MSRQGRRLLLGALAGVLLLALFFRGVDPGAIGHAFARADALSLGAALLATAGTYFLRAWRWGGLLAPLARVPFSQLFSATVIGFMAGIAIPRAGEVLRPYLIARRQPIRTSTGFASIVVERLVDLVTVLTLFAFYLVVLAPAGQIAPRLRVVLEASGLVAGASAIVVLLLLLTLHFRAEPALRFADRCLSVLPARLAGAAGRTLRSFASGLAVLHSPPRRLLALGAQSLALWLCIAAGIHWTNRAFGVELPFAGTFLILGFLTVGVSIPTPGMVGGFHEGYLLALTEVFGVDRQTAVAAGIAAHAVANLPVLLLGLAFLGREGLSVRSMTHLSDDGAARDEPGYTPRAAERSGDGGARTRSADAPQPAAGSLPRLNR